MISFETLDDLKNHDVSEQEPVLVKATGKIYLIKKDIDLVGKGIPHNTAGYFLQETTKGLPELVSVNKTNVEFIEAEKRIRLLERPVSAATNDKDLLTLFDGNELFAPKGNNSSLPKIITSDVRVESDAWLAVTSSSQEITVADGVTVLLVESADGGHTTAQPATIKIPSHYAEIRFSGKGRFTFFSVDDNGTTRWFTKLPGPFTPIEISRGLSSSYSVTTVNESSFRDSERIVVTDATGSLVSSDVSSSKLEILELLEEGTSTSVQDPYVDYSSDPTGTFDSLSIPPRKWIEDNFALSSDLPSGGTFPAPTIAIGDFSGSDVITIYEDDNIKLYTATDSATDTQDVRGYHKTSGAKYISRWYLNTDGSFATFQRNSTWWLTIVSDLSAAVAKAGTHGKILIGIATTDSPLLDTSEYLYVLDYYVTNDRKVRFITERIK